MGELRRRGESTVGRHGSAHVSHHLECHLLSLEEGIHPSGTGGTACGRPGTCDGVLLGDISHVLLVSVISNMSGMKVNTK